MKTITTLFAFLICAVVSAQDQVFVHKANSGNISVDASEIDHPDLNGDPNANFIVTHNLSHGGVQYNDNATGTYYNPTSEKWSVYNENGSNMIEGSSYNIYIPQGGKIINVEADGTDYRVEVSDPTINNNPDAVILYATHYNPNQVRNDNNYGVYYGNTNKWNIYNEAIEDIPAGAAFTLLIDEGSGGATSFTHTATAANSVSNYTVIDHESLNGKPEAYPVVAHNYTGTTVLLDKVIGVWYSSSESKWAIYTEDMSGMPQETVFNIYVADPTLDVENTDLADIHTYPNPTSGTVTFGSKEGIDQIVIYNMLGQEVKVIQGDGSNTFTTDISELALGNYIAKVQAGTAVQSIKLIKQ